jgi:hypothetical protein
MILYAPRAVVKFRLVAPDAKQRLISCTYTLYQGRFSLTEQLITNEWAMIGSLGDKTVSGEIPQCHRAVTRSDAIGTEVAFHHRIHEAELRTQNYDKGFEKFVTKYERNEAMSTTVALVSGNGDDHGWAVYYIQGPRRCPLLDTVDGLTDEETLWTALAAWATFKLRKVSPRKYTGKLFYPTEASHIFEKYWNHWPNLDEHPDFASQSPVFYLFFKGRGEIEAQELDTEVNRRGTAKGSPSR